MSISDHISEHDTDHIIPFVIEGLDVRGRIIRLNATVDKLLKRHDYPAPVARLVAQASALALMLANTIKLSGRLTLQAQTNGPISLLVVDVWSAHQYRAMAKFDQKQIKNQTVETAQLLGKGALAITIEPGGQSPRYQGIVELNNHTLEQAAQTYFANSEQIPTSVRLAVSELIKRTENATPNHYWQASGMMLQFLPSETAQHDNWTEAEALINTLSHSELADPDITSEQLLYQLFHERGVRVFEPVSIIETCSCSDEKVRNMLSQFSQNQLDESTSSSGMIEVTCQFCNRYYQFEPDHLYKY